MTGLKELPSLARRFHTLTGANPDFVAVEMDGEARTRRELDKRSNQIARTLSASGVRHGAFLTIALPNSIAFVEVCLACWKIGATPQPVSPRLPKVEMQAIAELAETPFVVVSEDAALSIASLTFADFYNQSADDSPLPDCKSPAWKAPTSGGSTGRPKLIVSGAASVYDPGAPALWKITSDDVVLMPGPLYHNGPFLTSFNALFEGAKLVLMPRFDAEQVLRLVQQHRATWLYLVPTMMSRIWKLPASARAKYDVRSLKTVWHLAAPCPRWLKESWIEWLGPDVIWEMYGATEGQAATAISGAEWLRKPGSVGRLIVGEMIVLNDNGAEAPPGTIGNLHQRATPGSAPTYYYRGATATTVRDDWETVGDVGKIDADGYVFLADRRSDLILVGGANVYPAEIEGAIEEHPDVLSSAVIGLPDDDLGERIHAIIQSAASLSLDDIKHFLAERLVSYKHPRSIEIVATPLRDEAGKVRRPQLRDERIREIGGRGAHSS